MKGVLESLPSIDIDALVDKLLGVVPDVAAAVVVLVAFALVYRVTRRPLELGFQKAALHEKLVELLVRKIYKYAMTIVAVVMAASQVGVNVGAAVAGLGVVGVAVGFASQDSLANLISGIIIFLDRPFIVGDLITVEGQFGRVTNITLRSTRLKTPVNSYVVIPNQKIIDAVLENHSKHGRLRVDVPVGIAYKERVDEARQVLLTAVGKTDIVLTEPEPSVVVEELGSSSVNLSVRAWISSADQRLETSFVLLERCKAALDEAGIEIPFPHLQLHVDAVSQEVMEALPPIERSSDQA